MKTMTGRRLAIPAAALLALTLAACGDTDDGAAEQAGERLDRAAERAGDKVDDAQRSTSRALEQAGDQVEEAGDRIESRTD